MSIVHQYLSLKSELTRADIDSIGKTLTWSLIMKSNFSEFHSNSKRGFSLLEGMVTIAILSIAGIAVVRSNVTSMKSIKSNNLRLEIQDIKKTISSRLSCPKTLGATIPTACSGPVVLRDNSNSPLVPASGKLGDWSITSRCEVLSGKNGLSVYVTKKTATGDFAKDPLNQNIVLDETSPVSLIFGADVRPCGNWFDAAATPTCGPGQYVKNVNFYSQTLTCADLPQCPVGQMLRGYYADGSPNCRESGSRVVGGVECMQCENGTICGERNAWGAASCSSGSPVCSAGSVLTLGMSHDEIASMEPCWAVCGLSGAHVGTFQCVIND